MLLGVQSLGDVRNIVLDVGHNVLVVGQNLPRIFESAFAKLLWPLVCVRTGFDCIAESVNCFVFCQLTKAKSQSTVLTSYRDLVRKGQDQFSKELDEIVPGVKLGESMFTVILVCVLVCKHLP